MTTNKITEVGTLWRVAIHRTDDTEEDYSMFYWAQTKQLQDALVYWDARDEEIHKVRKKFNLSEDSHGQLLKALDVYINEHAILLFLGADAVKGYPDLRYNRFMSKDGIWVGLFKCSRLLERFDKPCK